jgi:hypothetical protein
VDATSTFVLRPLRAAAVRRQHVVQPDTMARSWRASGGTTGRVKSAAADRLAVRILKRLDPT